jgi:hypothetical protein
MKLSFAHDGVRISAGHSRVGSAKRIVSQLGDCLAIELR